MKKWIGTYRLGDFHVDVFHTDHDGGYFRFRKNPIGIPELVIGFGADKWSELVSTVLHEAIEFELAHLGYRYFQSQDYGNDHSGYVFMLNHPQFSDVIG